MTTKDITTLWIWWNIILPGVAIVAVVVGLLALAAARSGVQMGWGILGLLIQEVEYRWASLFPPKHWYEREKWEARRRAGKKGNTA